MNVREEERQKNTCPSRGLGLAAAAIGVGVGAALYYIFSKRPENPDVEGSTSGWNTEEHHNLDNIALHDETDSYTTISEHITTDTSMEESDEEDSNTDSNSSFEADISESESENGSIEFSPRNNSLGSIRVDSDPSLVEIEDSSDSEIGADWDVTNSSTDSPIFFNMSRYPTSRRQRNVKLERATRLRDRAFRERSWSLEECSICFDVILKDQQVTTLPCTHNFHSDCITPWLQEQQTCPNCRKSAE